jgi:hypothetical protein
MSLLTCVALWGLQAFPEGYDPGWWEHSYADPNFRVLYSREMRMFVLQKLDE